MTGRRFGLAVACALAVAGCGGGDTSAEPAERASTAASAPSVPAATPSVRPSRATDEPAVEESATPTPQAPPSADTPEPSPSGPPASDDLFVAAVRAKVPEAAEGRSDEAIAALATSACRGLGSGTGAADILAGMQSLGTADASAVDEATARELVKLAIDTYCLEEADRVDEFGR